MVPWAVAVHVYRAQHVCEGNIGHGYPAALHLHYGIRVGYLQLLQRLDGALRTKGAVASDRAATGSARPAWVEGKCGLGTGR